MHPDSIKMDQMSLHIHVSLHSLTTLRNITTVWIRRLIFPLHHSSFLSFMKIISVLWNSHVYFSMSGDWNLSHREQQISLGTEISTIHMLDTRLNHSYMHTLLNQHNIIWPRSLTHLNTTPTYSLLVTKKSNLYIFRA